MAERLFHFSDDPSIEEFVPRAVRVPAKRGAGKEWLNEPLVWAIDEWHQPMYLFPRECPRILLWRTSQTSNADLQQYFGTSKARIIAYVEARWEAGLAAATLHRYELSSETFESLHDAGMWVSKSAVRPVASVEIEDPVAELKASDVELRVLPLLTPLRDVWSSTLHASGIRLRNAQDWEISLD